MVQGVFSINHLIKAILSIFPILKGYYTKSYICSSRNINSKFKSYNLIESNVLTIAFYISKDIFAIISDTLTNFYLTLFSYIYNLSYVYLKIHS